MIIVINLWTDEENYDYVYFFENVLFICVHDNYLSTCIISSYDHTKNYIQISRLYLHVVIIVWHGVVVVIM